MPKYIMPKYIKESETFDEIKEAIYELCPVKQPRIELNDDDYFEEKKLGIYISFYTDDDGSVHTQISFVRTNGNIAVSASNYCVVDKEISDDTIGKLVAFLLGDFPYVNNVEINSYGFEIEFVSGLEHFEQKGISCSKANIRFTNTFRKDNCAEIIQNYLSYIVSNFTTEMIRAPQMREMYKKYLNDIKEKLIASLSGGELRQFISLLTEEQLRELLLGMDNEQFFNLCDKLQKEDGNIKGNVRELKRIPINLGDGKN